MRRMLSGIIALGMVAALAACAPATPWPGASGAAPAQEHADASAPDRSSLGPVSSGPDHALAGWSYPEDDIVRVRDLDPLPAKWWDPGLIVSDANFFDADSMTTGEIQAFLEEQNPYCQTWHARTDREVDSGWPYRCLRDRFWDVPHLDEVGEDGTRYCDPISPRKGVSSAEVISIVATACGISPKTLLVTLEKEQGLVTDRWPWEVQFEAATGYACYDSAPCLDAYGGFVGQMYHAARTYQLYVQRPERFNYQPFAANEILFAPGCEAGTVHIKNKATAALYDYTPYQPNESVLRGLEGATGCDAYGNYNFWRLWFYWFGDPLADPGAADARTWPGVH